MVRSGLIDRARKLLAATASALLLLGALTQLLPTSAATGDWPKNRFDPGNTSYNPDETVISAATVNSLAEAWNLKIGFNSSPVVVNGVIYSPCQFTVRPIVPEMCAIDAIKGTLIWHSGQLGNIMDVTTAAFDNGRVFVGIQEPAAMVALDAAPGRIVWGHGVPFGYQINDGPTVANGTVFFTPDDGNLWALDEATGATKWTAPSGNFGGTPAYANGVVYVDGFQRINGAPNEFVDAFDAATGTGLWHATAQLGYQGSTLVVANGLVLHDTLAYNANGCNPGNTCDPVWSYRPSSTGVNITTPFAVAKGVGYIGLGDDSVHAVDLSNGSFMWRGTTNSGGSAGIPVGGPTVANRVVYAGAQDGQLYAWNAAGCGQSTCRPLWSMQLTTPGSQTSPKWVAAVANGAVYVNTSDGVLHALTPGGTPPVPPPSPTPAPTPTPSPSPAPTPGTATFMDLFQTPSQNGGTYDITAAPDGNLWFAEQASARIGKVTTDGKNFAEYGNMPLGANPTGITVGPDNNIWFTEGGEWDSTAHSVGPGKKIGRMNLAGQMIAEYTTPSAPSGPQGITTGPDGNIWFAETYANNIARFNVSTGVFTEWKMPKTVKYGGACSPRGVTAGPDGAVWFTEFACNIIGRIDMSGNLTEFQLKSATAQPLGIAVGPDHALWFTEWGDSKIGRLTIDGALTEWPLPSGHHNPQEIVAGPDRAMWFTERVDPRIGRITLTGSISEHLLPNGAGSYAQPLGIAKGPDGNVWFTDFMQQVGRVNVRVWDTALGPPQPAREAAPPPAAPSGTWKQRH